ncbi:CRISPR-associated helicase/endonuclease Cas3 [Actinoalloteichus caeruleus]|uniref:CRISPR-associated endonuclease/helicase Cas3 n=1 Tax=Actinoalloteichus caeruleus DSM 43889 TaxID=1120930 RepID=A0ABT1JFR3_ACTCY|nr:CRISPR-associated helicase/endonuclease Cas3 [Actinoalloteichus caeruleus]MCP2331049.1 CRISPR-associated endonuclease/helicase Cas3 [Actinoalloteichus caeruleus DSM 43889]
MTEDLPHLWAKSPAKEATIGESLTEHSARTSAVVPLIRARIGVVDGIWDESWWPAVQLAALLHDGGKIDPGFQRQVRTNTRWGLRHEVLSLGFVDLLVTDQEVRRRVAAAVVTHHRPLHGDATRSILPDNLSQDQQALGQAFTVAEDDGTVRALAAWFADAAARVGLPVDRSRLGGLTRDDIRAGTLTLLRDLAEDWWYPGTEQGGLPWVLLQGVVTIADHVASAHGELLTGEPLRGYGDRVRVRLAAAGHRLTRAQEEAAAAHHLLLVSPTGSGKTEGGLLWAEAAWRQVAEQRNALPRVFYVLPFLASINAMALRLQEEDGVEDVGVLHSRAGMFHLNELIEARAAGSDDRPEPTVEDAATALDHVNASRTHRELFRVTTPYQLLRAAFGGPGDSSTLADTVNSVFLFDELHAYEPRRLGMLLAMIRLWTQELGGRVGVLSATLPERFRRILRDTIAGRLDVVDGFAGVRHTPRHRLRIGGGHLTSPESVDRIAADLHAGQAVLVVANNVADALDLYDLLGPVAKEQGGEAVLLHSRFRNCDRAQKEKRILELFGTDRRSSRGLLVATQVVEVSLNVDFDVLHTSGAALEALLQRFGRVNRRGKRAPASVWVCEPEYRRRRGGGEETWADGVYDEVPTRLCWAALQNHDGETIDEADAQQWLNAIYDSPWGDTWEKEVLVSQERFDEDYLDFRSPFADREGLRKEFFATFDGVEAILSDDLADYQADRRQGEKGQGALLASRFLLPLPVHLSSSGHFDRRHGITVINGDYHPELGLKGIVRETRYQPGEIL